MIPNRNEILEIANTLLRETLKSGFDETAILIDSSKEVMVKISNNQPSIVQYWDEVTTSLYLVKNRRIATLEVTTTKIDEIVKTIKTMLPEVSASKESEYYAPLPRPEKVTPLPITVHESIIKALENPEKIVEKALAHTSTYNVDKVAGMFEVLVGTKTLITSAGAELSQDYGAYEYYIRVFKGEGNGQWASAGRVLNQNNIIEATDIASRYAVEAKKQESIPAETYDIIFSPMVIGNIFNLIGSMASAMYIDMGLSIFSGKKIGEEIGSKRLTLIDNPRNPKSYSATAFDHEGLATQTNIIIEKGKIKSLLHNSKTAKKYGVKSTANAGWIIPRPWSLELSLGEFKLEELISEIKRGILVTNNWYTRLQNYIEGDFSTVSRDAIFLIEHGKIVKAIKKLRIVDKLPRILRNVKALGNKRFQIKWWEVNIPVFTPYILIEKVHTSKHIF